MTIYRELNYFLNAALQKLCRGLQQEKVEKSLYAGDNQFKFLTLNAVSSKVKREGGLRRVLSLSDGTGRGSV